MLGCLVLLTFLPTLSQGWAPLDDGLNFLRNERYRGLGSDNLRWMWTTRHAGHYIPLSWMTLGADYLVSGMEPRGYHRTNLLLHLANALLFFALALRLLRPAGTGREASTEEVARLDMRESSLSILGAFAAASWFALHPLRVESVAWITERRDVLCGFFCLLAVHAYVRFCASTGGERRNSYALALGLFVAALLSKGIAVVLPVALLALDAGPLGRLEADPRGWRVAQLRALVLEKVPFVVLALVSAALTLWASAPVVAGAKAAGLEHRLLAAAFGLSFYLEKSFLPVSIPFQIPTTSFLTLRSDTLIALRGIGYLLLVACALLIWWRARRPQMALALLVFTAFVLPLSGLLQAGPQLAAHRYTYLACLPLCLFFGGFVQRASGALRPGLQGMAAAAILVLALLLALGARRQIALWRDGVTFASAFVRDAPLDWAAVGMLAQAHLNRGEDAMAVKVLRSGRARFPDAILLPYMESMVLATTRSEEVRDGVEALHLAERLVRTTSSQDPAALLALAAASAEMGDAAAARRLLESAQALASAGRKPELLPAVEEFRRRLEQRGVVRLSAEDWQRLLG